MKQKAKIYYISLPDEMRKEVKLSWLRETKFKDIAFERITPDAKHNWINLSDNDFDSLIPICAKDKSEQDQAIFKKIGKGLQSKRQEWIYDFSKENLKHKIQHTVNIFNQQNSVGKKELSQKIKWSRELERHLKNNIQLEFSSNKIQTGFPRPFSKHYIYFDKHLISYIYDWESYINNPNDENKIIAFNTGSVSFASLAVNCIIDEAGLLIGGGTTVCLSLNTYSNNERTENITDWALQKFQLNYQDTQITKQDIFHYVYAVLHNPSYRNKYELNLKREFPRIPFYDDFNQWARWGKSLMDLHINYESVTPFELNRQDAKTQRKTKEKEANLFDKVDSETVEAFVSAPKTKLKADKGNGIIEVDSITTLEGVPAIAWEYKLGNRSALEWILDQYKERKPQDSTIAEKFNTYKFEDYKDTVIELLKKVCTVSVETQKIIEEMKKKIQ